MFAPPKRPLVVAMLLFFSLEMPALADSVGFRNLRIHDPSTPIYADGTWWVFGTGKHILSARSNDLITWQRIGSVLASPPAWAASVVPGNKDSYYWAPDLIRIGGRYLLYYSVSEFGKNTSAIALVTNTTLDANAPGHQWIDRGIVIKSGKNDSYNAIDPSLLLDSDGRLWMVFGSFWHGLFLIELDPSTGLRLQPETKPIHLAYATEIEAATLYQRLDYYYLFFNEGLCCKGSSSAYRIRVGRSRSVTGPYLDDTGRDLRDGGGREFLGTQGNFIGPGHVGLVRDGTSEWATMHFYDGTRNGQPMLGIRRLAWSGDGWPHIAD
jgi:arabinan endo-1,5-alpha-L-arabinosidase